MNIEQLYSSEEQTEPSGDASLEILRLDVNLSAPEGVHPKMIK